MSLVRTVPGHLMRPSEAKDEFSEAGTCQRSCQWQVRMVERYLLSFLRLGTEK